MFLGALTPPPFLPCPISQVRKKLQGHCPPIQRLQTSEEQTSGPLQSGKERGSRESRGEPETRARRRPLSLPVPFPRPHLLPPGRGWGTRSPLSHRLLGPVPSCSHLLPSYNHLLIPGAHSQGVRRPARPQQSLLLLPPTSAPGAPPTQSRRPLPTSLGVGVGRGLRGAGPSCPGLPSLQPRAHASHQLWALFLVPGFFFIFRVLHSVRLSPSHLVIFPSLSVFSNSCRLASLCLLPSESL